MNIIRSQDCRNSPKNQLVENLAVALLTNEVESLSNFVTEDVKWQMVGEFTVHGRRAIVDHLSSNSRSIEHLTIVHAITHGKTGAVNGEIRYKASAVGFSFVFEFANAKGKAVRLITSYFVVT